VLYPSPAFSQLVLPSGLSCAYTLNNVGMHLNVGLLLGFVQLTRTYLST
jgi:hypothetical protein